MLGFLTKAFTGAVANPVTKLATTFFGDKEKRDEMDSHENIAGLEQYAAEFQHRENRTWWDSFVDGVNRLMRPSSFFTFLGLIWLAMYSPTRFTIVASGLAIIPEQVWIIFGIMVGFLFPSRLLERGVMNKLSKGISKKDIQNIVTAAKEVNALRKEMYEDINTKDEVNESILEWKRLKS